MDAIRFVQENGREILNALMIHIRLVGISVLIGVLVSIPLGILLTRAKKAAKYVLAGVSTVQTIPGLVMLGFAMLLFGVGSRSAIIVLSLYAILPILRNTYTGITEVDKSYIEAGRGIGMTDMQILFKVELPLAASSIIGGLKLSTIYIVSWATLAGLIGAGGLGDLIWTGLSTYETLYIWSGAIPSALLAIALGLLIGVIQRGLTPRGLRGAK
jgi:osmoprotectant transport system permease protein